MKYYKLENQVYAFEADGSQDEYITEDMVRMTSSEVDKHVNPKKYMTDEQLYDIYIKSLRPLTRRQFKLVLLDNDLLGGLKLRKQLEQEAFKMVRNLNGTKELPAQTLKSFLNGKSQKFNEEHKFSSPSGIIPVDFNDILPTFMSDRLKDGLNQFQNKMKGFINDEALLYGIESRTSCPLRVTRDETTLESLSHQGLYPCGEGAGYAGGITSAAVDVS